MGIETYQIYILLYVLRNTSYIIVSAMPKSISPVSAFKQSVHRVGEAIREEFDLFVIVLDWLTMGLTGCATRDLLVVYVRLALSSSTKVTGTPWRRLGTALNIALDYLIPH